jgi:hypothetical protein
MNNATRHRLGHIAQRHNTVHLYARTAAAGVRHRTANRTSESRQSLDPVSIAQTGTMTNTASKVDAKTVWQNSLR